MQMNLVRLFTLGCLTLISTLVFADPIQQTATITLVNPSDSAYSVFDYITEGNAFFTNQPSFVRAHDSVTFNTYLNAPGSSAAFKFRDSAYNDCVMNPEDLWGKCAEIKATYNEIYSAPVMEMWDNLRKANACTISMDYENHHSTIKCITKL